MIIQRIKFHLGICLLIFSNCHQVQDSTAIPWPIEANLVSYWFQPPNINYNGTFYKFKANVQFVNKSSDTLFIMSGQLSHNVLCDVNFSIIRSDSLFLGIQYLDLPIFERIIFLPNDTLDSVIFFLLEKNYLEMEELYLNIIPEFSLSMSLSDTTINRPVNKLAKNIAYRPSYRFHIDLKNNQIKKSNIDIDSLIKEKHYSVQKVDFW